MGDAANILGKGPAPTEGEALVDQKSVAFRRNSVAAGIVNAMSVDVEEYFQVGAFENCIRRQDWPRLTSCVERQTRLVLNLFDRTNVSATFFILGWVGERHPELIREIAAAGHEIASHGSDHQRVHTMEPEAFRQDVRDSRRLLEDITGQSVVGYRAPSFSIGAQNLWALDILAEEGYSYSSSIYPVHHDHYGMPEAPRAPFHPVEGASFVEFPASTVSFFGRNVPCSGGGYFRLMPYGLSRRLIARLNRTEERPAIFYFHPWEIDPEQPRVKGAPIKSRLRHYTNLGVMEAKLEALLGDFRWDRVDRVISALSDQGPR